MILENKGIETAVLHKTVGVNPQWKWNTYIENWRKVREQAMLGEKLCAAGIAYVQSRWKICIISLKEYSRDQYGYSIENKR